MYLTSPRRDRYVVNEASFSSIKDQHHCRDNSYLLKYLVYTSIKWILYIHVPMYIVGVYT